MRIITLVSVIAAIALAPPAASAQASRVPESTLRRVATEATDLDLRRQLASATPATIDSLLLLYSDSVVYEHPNARAVVRGKDDLKRGMTRFIGSVRALHVDTMRVTTGPGVAIVETVVRMEIDDGGTWTPVTRRGLRVVEVDARGLVRRIIDYPW